MNMDDKIIIVKLPCTKVTMIHVIKVESWNLKTFGPFVLIY